MTSGMGDDRVGIGAWLVATGAFLEKEGYTLTSGHLDVSVAVRLGVGQRGSVERVRGPGFVRCLTWLLELVGNDAANEVWVGAVQCGHELVQLFLVAKAEGQAEQA